MSDLVHIEPSARVSGSLEVVGKGRLHVGALAVIESHVLIDVGGSGHGLVELGPRSKLKFGTVVRTYNGSFLLGSRSSLGEDGVWAAHGGITIGAK